MKKLIAIVMMLIFSVILIGCSHKSKSRIETAFEKYASETLVDKSELKDIKSIELTDSVDFYNMAQETAMLSEQAISEMDSITELYYKALPNAPKSRIYSHDVQDKLNSHIDFIKMNQYEIAVVEVATKSLRQLIDSVSNLNKINRSYKIKVELKSNPEYVIYYAQDFAFADSIAFSKDPIVCDYMPDAMKRASQFIELITSEGSVIVEHTNRMKEIISMLQK